MATKRLFDDLARLATDAAGAAQGVRREVEGAVRGQMERMMRDMDVATREEVEVLRDLVASLRAETETLRDRVAALEGQGSRPQSPLPGAANDVATA